MAAVGPLARERFLADFTASSACSTPASPTTGRDPDVPQAASLAVGGTLARVYEAIVSDRTAELPGLLPDLTFEMLVPFVGEDAARAERCRVAAGAELRASRGDLALRGLAAAEHLVQAADHAGGDLAAELRAARGSRRRPLRARSPPSRSRSPPCRFHVRLAGDDPAALDRSP